MPIQNFLEKYRRVMRLKHMEPRKKRYHRFQKSKPPLLVFLNQPDELGTLLPTYKVVVVLRPHDGRSSEREKHSRILQMAPALEHNRIRWLLKRIGQTAVCLLVSNPS